MSKSPQTPRSPGPGEVTSTIGAQDRVRGDLHVGGCVRIDGVIRGNVDHLDPHATAIVGPRGHVSGSIRVRNVWIEGQVVGDVRADGHVEIAPGAVVKGDIAYGTLRLSAGAEVNGQLRCARAEMRADES